MVPGGQTRTSDRRSDRSSGGLRLNFLTAQLSSDRIECTEVPYRSHQDLKDLRERTAGTHIALRHRNSVQLVELQDGVPRIGDPIALDIPRQGSRIVARLIQEALKRVVTERWGYTLRKVDPPVFVSRQQGRDLLGHVHDELPATAAFHVYPEYRLDGRYLSATRTVGVVIGLKTRHEMDLTAADLLRLGMDLRGRYVLTADGVGAFAHQDPKHARRLLGVVRETDGDLLHVDTGEGMERHRAEDLWLETRRDNFDQALARVARTETPRIMELLELGKSELTGGPGRLAITRRIAEGLAGLGHVRLARDLRATFGRVLGDDPEQQVPRVTRFTEPTFAFDLAGDKSARYAEHGLRQHGPFDLERFTPKTPHLVVVTPNRFQHTVEQFVRSFRDGVPDSSFVDGFVSRFRLDGLEVSLVPFDGAAQDADAYRSACRRAITKHPTADSLCARVS